MRDSAAKYDDDVISCDERGTTLERWKPAASNQAPSLKLWLALTKPGPTSVARARPRDTHAS